MESHNLAEKQHMSFDFKMPVGTPIVAIDDGRIVLVTENFKDNKDNESFQSNFIGIEHEGGILSWYGHLMFEGAIVKAGDKVLQGEVIGYSGNTGNSAYPHLHLYAQQITEDCFDAENSAVKLELCPPIPISFKNANPSQAILTEFKTYTALPYES
ncbi:M23 family metallopeptidase [Thalassomonas sp. RHCl1]|uniref:M23 family metallopeptidase n=1 Tax=Thalassomonas sp. RHCl1 TaxID=2995320 RepID=UPI00248AEEC6|nr:M23 family metallopeptidase [Thalassomonas sp. RHCl1]